MTTFKKPNGNSSLLSMYTGDIGMMRFFHEELIRTLQTLYWALRLYSVIKQL
ncbi:Uncharacterized protein ALO91_01578 [Pseudomonas syringae pv. aceris]|uniref:Uncharacterized protein n=1 Tax=Pseudomonas syringae pv. aceris TaxID=199198 RepID=A0A0P9M9H7_PSESX|nr:Uncharacterized protein ALO91_01578 [Pseudomonas syringae pv. aceris]